MGREAARISRKDRSNLIAYYHDDDDAVLSLRQHDFLLLLLLLLRLFLPVVVRLYRDGCTVSSQFVTMTSYSRRLSMQPFNAVIISLRLDVRTCTLLLRRMLKHDLPLEILLSTHLKAIWRLLLQSALDAADADADAAFARGSIHQCWMHTLHALGHINIATMLKCMFKYSSSCCCCCCCRCFCEIISDL